MYLRMIGNDVRRSPTTTLITMLLTAAPGAHDGTPEALRHREERLTAWLTQMGF
jgi:hypothetical protein